MESAGSSRDCTGRGGADLTIPVPVGTVVQDVETREVIGDLTSAGQAVLVAKGGRGRLGKYALQEQHESLAAPARLRNSRREAHARRSS